MSDDNVTFQCECPWQCGKSITIEYEELRRITEYDIISNECPNKDKLDWSMLRGTSKAYSLYKPYRKQ